MSYLGTRTQTPSSSPDPFSSYEMQRRLNKSCMCAQNSVSQKGFMPTSWEQLGNSCRQRPAKTVYCDTGKDETNQQHTRVLLDSGSDYPGSSPGLPAKVLQPFERNENLK